jgi:hypothetical protein
MLDERQSAISPLAYLAELLKYTTEHVNDGDDAVTVDTLETQFHQPFWRYLTQVNDDFVYVDEVDKPVRQVRGCIEVLRRYSQSANKAIDPEAYKNYLFEAYQTLLNQIGTYDDDLRRAVTQEDKESLANRLGIHAKHVDELRRLTRDTLTEDILEEFFGLPSTTRDSLSDGLKIGDDLNLIDTWKFKGIEWGQNTDPDGCIYVNVFIKGLSRLANKISVKIYRHEDLTDESLLAESEKTAKSRSGRVSGKTIAFNTSPDIAAPNGLSGTLSISASGETPSPIKIQFRLLPRFLCWRLQHLREHWQQQDWQSNPYIQHQLPIIDPDLIGPDDFRSSLSSNPPFTLWKQRRQQLDEALYSTQQEIHANGLIATIESKLSKSIPRLKQLAAWNEQGKKRNVIARELKNLGFGIDAVKQLIELVNLRSSGQRLTLSQINEGCSILLLSIKQELIQSWINEEVALESDLRQKVLEENPDLEQYNVRFTLLSPNYFWTSPSQLQEGEWPTVQIQNGRFFDELKDEGDFYLPFIDPEITDKSTLPEFFDKQLAVAFWDLRKAELFSIKTSLEEDYRKNDQDISTLIDSVLAPVITDEGDDNNHTDGLDMVPYDFKTETYSWLKDIKRKALSSRDNPDAPAIETWEVEKVLDRLTSLKKYQELYLNWSIEEQNLFPAIDPDILPTKEVARLTDSLQAIRLWEKRKAQLDNLKSLLEIHHHARNLTEILKLVWGSYGSVSNLRRMYGRYDKSETPQAIYNALKNILGIYCLSAEELQFLIKIQDQYTEGLVISDEDWEKVSQLIIRSWKLCQFYKSSKDYDNLSEWVFEEKELFANDYWRIYKSQLPLWRATLEARQQWQYALQLNSQPPIINPVIIGNEDLSNDLTLNPAKRLLEIRHKGLTDQINALKEVAESASPWKVWDPKETDLLGSQGCALDSQGFLYVADGRHNCIKKFSPEGHLLLKWGSQGSKNGQFHLPADITVDSDDIVYVVDSHAIQTFDTDGNFLSRFADEADSRLRGIVVSDDGIIYTAAPGPNCIKLFDVEGNHLATWTGEPDHPFKNPSGLALDSSGCIYVADHGNHQIQKLDGQGNWLKNIGQRSASTPDIPQLNGPWLIGAENFY